MASRHYSCGCEDGITYPGDSGNTSALNSHDHRVRSSCAKSPRMTSPIEPGGHSAPSSQRSEIPYTIRIEFDQRLVLVGSDTVYKGERSVIEDDPAVVVPNQDNQV